MGKDHEVIWRENRQEIAYMRGCDSVNEWMKKTSNDKPKTKPKTEKKEPSEQKKKDKKCNVM